MAAEGNCPSQFTGQSWPVWTQRLGKDRHIKDNAQDIKQKPDFTSHDCSSQLVGRPWTSWADHLRREGPISEEGIEQPESKPNPLTYDCPSQFMGQPWSVWTEHIRRESPICDIEDEARKHQADAVRLPREDMGLFGHCPEQDPFYTAVCEFCNSSVKPQGLRHHIAEENVHEMKQKSDLTSHDCSSQLVGAPWTNWTGHIKREGPINEEDVEPDSKPDPLTYDCPSQFMGQPWSVWTEHMRRESPVCDVEDGERKHQADAVRLPREDMGLFGHCPEQDPFYTAVCELCNLSVKPQGLRNHMDLWHKVTTIGVEPCEKTIKCSVGPKPGPGAKANSGNVKIKVKKPQSNSSGGAPCVPMERFLSPTQTHLLAANVIPTDGVVSLTKGADKLLLQPENAISVGRNQAVAAGPVSLQPVVALTPLPSANELATIMSIFPRLAFQAITETLNTSNTNTVAASSHNHSLNILSGDQLNHSQKVSSSPQKKRLKSERLPTKEREYDPDKHCGVWNEKSNKHCTHSLTCKAHSTSMRRAVMGRSKHFDKLLADHRAAKEMAGKLSKTLGIVKVSGLDADGGQLPSSVNGSTTAVPIADVPKPCMASPATPISISSDGQVNGIQNSSSDSHCASYPVSAPPPPILPEVTVDSFTPVTSVTSLPSKSPVLASVDHFTPSACHLPRPPEELATLKFVPRLEEVTWLRSHPKPVTVCSFSSRKLGDVVANNRRVEFFCHGLKTALTQECIRIPHSIQRTAKEKVLAVRQKPVAQWVVYHS